MQKDLKFLFVGDGSVGKTCILIMYTTDTFPSNYVPTVSDNFSMEVTYQDKIYNMDIWDTAGQEEYAYLRAMSYNNTNVFFLCFSIVDPTSYSNAEKSWYPEIRHHCPEALVILVGTKMDLRNDKATIEDLMKRFGRSPITFDQGLRLAERIKAYTYLECSARTKTGLKEVFDSGVLACFDHLARPPIKKRKCSLL